MASPAGFQPNGQRLNLYICCESLDFTWDLAEIEEFEEMWKMGIPLDYIAQNFGRKNEEVALLVMDRARLGHIQPREGGMFGKGE
jgi:hypothetical protein